MSFLRKDYSQERPKKALTPSQAKVKIAAFCAYQERSQQEVRNKLYDYGLYSEDVEDLLSEMITEGFVNESRFAEAFVRGKFKLKKWGRVKIQQALQQHRLTQNCIKEGMKEINPDEYWEILLELAEKKWASTSGNDFLKRKAKVQRFLLYRGFENDLIQAALEEVMEDI